FNSAVKKWMPLQPFHLIGGAMPMVRERLKTYDAYAHSTVEEIYGQDLKRAKEFDVSWLESTVFLNRGDHFEARPLPAQSQMGPRVGCCVCDCDGGGGE